MNAAAPDYAAKGGSREAITEEEEHCTSRRTHDLRHTGSTWTAQSGATLKELMARIGHSSTRAAMIYQHATEDRDQAIAAALDALITEAMTAQPDQSGTEVARPEAS
jgi:integrase